MDLAQLLLMKIVIYFVNHPKKLENAILHKLISRRYNTLKLRWIISVIWYQIIVLNHALKSPYHLKSVVYGNILNKFHIILSSLTNALKQLLKKKSFWICDESLHRDFELKKKIIIKAPCFRYLDQKKSVTL